jgi:hypothetical protein
VELYAPPLKRGDKYKCGLSVLFFGNFLSRKGVVGICLVNKHCIDSKPAATDIVEERQLYGVIGSILFGLGLRHAGDHQAFDTTSKCIGILVRCGGHIDDLIDLISNYQAVGIGIRIGFQWRGLRGRRDRMSLKRMAVDVPDGIRTVDTDLEKWCFSNTASK